MIDVTFCPAHAEDLDSIVGLLSDCGLPHEDIPLHVSDMILVKKGDQLIGTVGLEAYNGDGLLRSLAVSASYRNRGLAQALLTEVVAYARSKDVHQLFLLTTTATGFFSKRGFTVVERNTVPDNIAATKEFRSLCPSTASCMRREL